MYDVKPALINMMENNSEEFFGMEIIFQRRFSTLFQTSHNLPQKYKYPGTIEFTALHLLFLKMVATASQS